MIEQQRQLRNIEERLERLEKLDLSFYDEGTWTPTYNGATPGTTTYSLQQGGYIRINNIVVVTGTIVWTNATGSGAVRITLPFTPVNSSNQNYSAAVYTNGVTFAATGIQAFIAPNTALLRLFSPATNAGSTELTVEVAGEIRFTAVYFTLD